MDASARTISAEGERTMIRILLSNGETRKWSKDEYTEYDIKGRFFVVIKGDQWVGMYALDSIISVEVEQDE